MQALLLPSTWRPVGGLHSKHPAKVLQKRIVSYPTPKMQKLAHQNIRCSTPLKENEFYGPAQTWSRKLCLEYIIVSLGVHTERLHKRNKEHQPIVHIKVMQKRLEDDVLHDDNSASSRSSVSHEQKPCVCLCAWGREKHDCMI